MFGSKPPGHIVDVNVGDITIAGQAKKLYTPGGNCVPGCDCVILSAP